MLVTTRRRKKYYEEPLFIDTDDGENEDAVIGDEPLFDEWDEDDEEYNKLLQSGDAEIAIIEGCSFLAPKVANDEWLYNNIFSNYQDSSSCKTINSIEVAQELGPETKDHPKHEYNIPKSSEYIDFIGIRNYLFLYSFKSYFRGIISWWIYDVQCTYGQISFSIFG